MPRLFWIVLTALTAPFAASAQGAGSPLVGLSFLVGDWRAGDGRVAENGGSATGRSTITLEAGGNVLLRRDHTDLSSATGQPAGSFEQVMMIYPEGGTIRADYSDGTHVIHYVAAEVAAGRSVAFTSARRPDAPTFRLRYDLVDQATLSVAFDMAPPGADAFHPIASGVLRKAR